MHLDGETFKRKSVVRKSVLIDPDWEDSKQLSKRINAYFATFVTSESSLPGMQLPPDKKIYFASDFHLGLPDYNKSMEREKLICRWLDDIEAGAAALYLVGDLFDVWFEYKNVVPKGYTRFLGKLAALSDKGLRIEIFVGNHDLWMKDYFPKELGITVHHDPIEFTVNEKTFFVGHGDGLGPSDLGYKMLKKLFKNRFAQWLYRRIHPDTGIRIASYFSRLGEKHVMEGQQFLGEDKEWLIQFCKEKLQEKPIDYFIFGHRHLPIVHSLNEKSTYINLGDWLQYNSYAVFDGVETKLKYFK